MDQSEVSALSSQIRDQISSSISQTYDVAFNQLSEKVQQISSKLVAVDDLRMSWFDLVDKPTIPVIDNLAPVTYVDAAVRLRATRSQLPKKLSELENDIGLEPSEAQISGYVKKSQLQAVVQSIQSKFQAQSALISSKQDKITQEAKLSYDLVSGGPTFDSISSQLVESRLFASRQSVQQMWRSSVSIEPASNWTSLSQHVQWEDESVISQEKKILLVQAQGPILSFPTIVSNDLEQTSLRDAQVWVEVVIASPWEGWQLSTWGKIVEIYLPNQYVKLGDFPVELRQAGDTFVVHVFSLRIAPAGYERKNVFIQYKYSFDTSTPIEQLFGHN